MRRIVIAVPGMFGISLVLFTILALAPGDPFGELATNPTVPLPNTQTPNGNPISGGGGARRRCTAGGSGGSGGPGEAGSGRRCRAHSPKRSDHDDVDF